MAWKIELSRPAQRQLSRVDREVARRIAHFLRDRVAPSEDPRSLGKAMQGKLAGTWAYRVGDYRLICKIEDSVVTIIVIEIGHRGDIYR